METPKEILKKHLVNNEIHHDIDFYIDDDEKAFTAILSAMKEYRHQTRRYNLLRLPFRILSLPFLLIMLILGSIRQLISHSFNFIVYGGETLAYKNKNSYKMITEVYSKLEDLIKTE